MNVTEARARLAEVRCSIHKLTTEAQSLKNLIVSRGANVDLNFVRRQKRNKAIYYAYLRGTSKRTLAKKYNITSAQIGIIVRRIEHFTTQNKTKAGD